MLEIIILAAGMGKRMQSQLPKVMHTLANRPLLFHVVDRAIDLNADKIHIVVGHGGDFVRQAVNEKYASDRIQFVEQAEQLGTGHAVQQVSPYLTSGSNVIILYGDVPLIQPNTLLKMSSLVNASAMALLTVMFENPTGYGRIIRDASGNVVEIVEQKDANETQLTIRECNSGVMAITSDNLLQWLPMLNNDNAQKEFYLTDLVAIANQQGVNVNPTHPNLEYEVLGINNRNQQAMLERVYQQLVANQLLNEGVTLLDPNRFDCRGNVRAGKDCVIDVNCVFEGQIVLGDNVYIGPNCHIINSEIASNCQIRSHSVIEQSQVSENCIVGPFARLRPQTKLAENVKIGNFVEIKKAEIDRGSKVNHLSYIGDAIVGKDVNVGAGTITCNYDGANKWVTEIKDNVFVGSNTAFVAPVTVEEDATIGAGSVINKKVEKDQLAICRARQQNLDGWKRPVKKS